MRSFKEFIADVVKKPPMLFPLVALGHILWLLWLTWNDRFVPLGIEWLQVLWMAGYTFFWIAASDMRKWGALGYMFLTMINIIIFLTAKSVYTRDVYMSSLFLIDGLFSFFLVFYYKKFR